MSENQTQNQKLQKSQEIKESISSDLLDSRTLFIFECGLSFKDVKPYQVSCYTNRTYRECLNILTDNVFDCKGTPFLRSDKENTFMRGWPYRRNQIAIISTSNQLKITQREVRSVIENNYNYKRI